VNDSGDGGLLGLAFHPEHATPGEVPTVVVTEASQPLEPPALLQNFPNPFFPFNPYTLIPFTVAEGGWVEVIVFDLLGRQVRILTEGLMPAGRHAVLWDGTNKMGQLVGAGVYIYQLRTSDFVQARKMTLL
jgi:hypothetical protein